MLKTKTIIARNIEYKVVFLMITVMSKSRYFMMAIPIKAPEVDVRSIPNGIKYRLSTPQDTIIFTRAKEITKKLIRMYSMWRLFNSEVSRWRARNRNQHEDQIKKYQMGSEARLPIRS